jgi:hypothetical protein
MVTTAVPRDPSRTLCTQQDVVLRQAVLLRMSAFQANARSTMCSRLPKTISELTQLS